MKHMTVKYDKDSNTLIYDRKLKDGPGNNMYGLEVCKSLDLPFDFLTRAHDIRMKYNKEDENTLSRKTSHFNSLKVKGMCELCNERLGKDIHHLNYQQNANQHNYIEEDDLMFHKNHKANLVNICEECHDKVHKENIIYKKQKSEKGYIFTRVNERDV
jgi:DNA mismatch repair protein MutS